MSNRNTKSNWTSFSLLNLMALATIVAVWLPWWLARKEPERLQTEIDLMNQALGRLIVNDPSEFVAVQLPRFSNDLETWRFHIPDGMKVEACLAIEGIHDLALPKQFKRLELPPGKHEMSLIFKRHHENGFRYELYLDGDLHLKLKRPVAWLASGGSSSQGGIGALSEVYDLTKSQMMKKLVYTPVLRSKSSGSIYLTPDSLASAKGCYLWLQPVGYAPKPTPDWIDETSPGYPRQLGIREGVRLCQQNEFQPGLQIHHPQSMARQLPLAEIIMEFESNEADLSLSMRNLETGKWKFSDKPDVFVQPKLQARTERQQSSYLIHQFNRQGFPNAEPPVPIVELLFDLDHPDEVGFRLVPPESGIPVDRWKIRVVHHAGQYWKTLITRQGRWTSDDDPSNIEFATLPRLQHKEVTHRAIEIRSPVEDSVQWEELQVPRNQRFESMPQRHTWLVPEGAANEESPMRLSVNVSRNDDQTIPIPGGPVITEVILDIESPDDSIHWYRIDVQPFDE